MGQVTLVAVFGQFAQEVVEIEGRFVAGHLCGNPSCGSCRPRQTYAREYCVVRLYDAWAWFCRELVLCSAAGRPTTRGGTRLPSVPGVATRAGALKKLCQSYPPGTQRALWGPRWADAGDCLRAAQYLSPANFPTIASAIGCSPSPADDLRLVRNFAAHHSQQAALAVAEVATKVGVRRFQGVEHLVSQPVLPGVSLMTSWAGRLRQIAYAATA